MLFKVLCESVLFKVLCERSQDQTVRNPVQGCLRPRPRATLQASPKLRLWTHRPRPWPDSPGQKLRPTLPRPSSKLRRRPTCTDGDQTVRDQNQGRHRPRLRPRPNRHSKTKSKTKTKTDSPRGRPDSPRPTPKGILPGLEFRSWRGMAIFLKGHSMRKMLICIGTLQWELQQISKPVFPSLLQMNRLQMIDETKYYRHGRILYIQPCLARKFK